MKIIDAVWEKRNLGVDAMEFELAATDPVEESIRTIISKEKQYNVVKAPVGNIELNRALSENGYIYAEVMFHIVNDLRRRSVHPLHQRLCDEIHYDEMDDSDLEELFHELEKGFFRTDRIALDPKFSIEIANKRYANWIKDDMLCGSRVFKEIYHDETINFFICKKISDHVFSPFLGGTYEKYIKTGFGIPCMLKSVEICQSLGATQLISNVSSNNYMALKGNLMVGYQINGVQNVFVKHND